VSNRAQSESVIGEPAGVNHWMSAADAPLAKQRRRRTGWRSRAVMSAFVKPRSSISTAASRTRRSRCPGSRRCCCPAACGPARPREEHWNAEAEQEGGEHRPRLPGPEFQYRWVVVNPSVPQFQDRLSSVPSLFDSPLASLYLPSYDTRSRRVKPSWLVTKLIEAFWPAS